MAGTQDEPVLIAGGGLVGLSAAMFLAQHGVASTAIERLHSGSALPRAAHFHLRTLELFRLAGIDDAVQAQSEREFLPEGAIVMMDNLSGRKLADIIASLNEGVEAVSPCRRLFLSQPGLEPILRARAEQAGARVVSGHEVVDVEQDGDGVTVLTRSVDSGQEQQWRGPYLIAADGAHSVIRERLGIPFEGRGVFSNSITIYFTADLRPQLAGKPLSVIYINNETFGGFFRLDRRCQSGFLVINTVTDAADAAADTTEARLVDLVRIGAGEPALAVRIDGLARWRATADVARSYQQGRIFLAGDAAHVMPPNGGFGGNTGIHDAHNLAWKMALVLHGHADQALLDTYDTERRPVGRFTVEQAYTRYVTRTAPQLGVETAAPLVADLEIELGYRYQSRAAGSADGVVHGDPREGAVAGARLPHAWLDVDGRRVSTIDLTGSTFAVLAGPDGADWCTAASALAAAHPGLDLHAHHLTRPASVFATTFGLSDSGVVLVRPDGFVSWTAGAMVGDPSSVLGGALRQALTAAP